MSARGVWLVTKTRLPWAKKWLTRFTIVWGPCPVAPAPKPEFTLQTDLQSGVVCHCQSDESWIQVAVNPTDRHRPSVPTCGRQ
jgi:hypothetical protein